MTTKKSVMKAPLKKETKIIPSSSQIVAKKIGANFIATIEKKQYTRKVSTEEAGTLKEKILLYNKRPSERAKQQIIKLLTPTTTITKEKKEKLEMEKKGYEKLEKKKAKRESIKKRTGQDVIEDVKNLVVEDTSSIPKLQAILDSLKEKERQTTPASNYGRSRPGEY